LKGTAHIGAGDFRRMVHGLQCKSTLLLCAVVLASVVLAGAVFVSLAKREILHAHKSRADELACALAAASTDATVNADRVALLDLAERYVRQPEIVSVAFADASGRLLAAAQKHSKYLADQLEQGGQVIPVRQLANPVVQHTADGEAFVEIAEPIYAATAIRKAPQRLAGYIRLGLDLQHARARVAKVVDAVIGMTLAIMLLTIPLGFVVVRRIVHPIGRLREAAGRLAKGHLDERVEIGRRDEIGQLGTAFNQMADDLATSQNALVKLNAELEDRVLRRTEELQFANERLRQEMADKDDFLRAVSHDLNAPLRNVAGMSRSLLRKHGDDLPGDARHRLERIAANVEAEIDLIGDLLELSRIRTRREAKKPIDLNAELDRMVSQFDYDLGRSDGRIVVDGPLPTLYCERNRIRQVFGNLIDNALKYARPDAPPEIHVGCHERPEHFEFYVADNGLGVPSEERERIFYVFRRARTDAVATVPGKGVGLASCKSIVQNYDGCIWVEPNTPAGSVFRFRLSRHAVTDAAADADPSPQHAQAHA